MLEFESVATDSSRFRVNSLCGGDAVWMAVLLTARRHQSPVAAGIVFTERPAWLS